MCHSPPLTGGSANRRFVRSTGSLVEAATRATGRHHLPYGLASQRTEQIKTFEIEDGRVEQRAVTGPDYGRISNHEYVTAVRENAGIGTGDTRWKVPGVPDWHVHPRVNIIQDTTTLYASDRDIFLFLVDGSQSDRGWPALGSFSFGLISTYAMMWYSLGEALATRLHVRLA